MHSLHFNLWALLVSAILQWIVGGIWYSVLFQRPWIAATGYVKGFQPGGEHSKGGAFAMATSFVVSLILSFMLAHVILWAGANDPHFGALIGFICWLGFIAGPMFAQTLYEQRPMQLFLINSGYWLAAMVLSGVLLAVWQ